MDHGLIGWLGFMLVRGRNVITDVLGRLGVLVVRPGQVWALCCFLRICPGPQMHRDLASIVTVGLTSGFHA